MPARDVVVIGASAGGVEALRELVRLLPADLPAAVLVVLHVPAMGRSALPSILQRGGSLPVRHAENGDPLTLGEILVAPANRHLLVYDHAVGLSSGPRENGHRPAIDVLFRTAAQVLGPQVISVVLSGTLDDGTAGSVAVKMRGGTCLAQDPEDALHESMPQSAINAGCVDVVAAVPGLVEALVELAGQPVPGRAPTTPLMNMESVMADNDPRALPAIDRPGTPAGFSCPDCQGVLYQIQEGGLVRYRCRVGHAWSSESLLAQQSTAYEGALWMALRGLEEKAALTRNLAARARDRGHHLSAESFESSVAESVHAAELVRELITRMGGIAPPDSTEVNEPDSLAGEV